MALLVGASSLHPKVEGLIPGWSTFGRQPIDVIFDSNVSLLSLSKKQYRHILVGILKNK